MTRLLSTEYLCETIAKIYEERASETSNPGVARVFTEQAGFWREVGAREADRD